MRLTESPPPQARCSRPVRHRSAAALAALFITATLGGCDPGGTPPFDARELNPAGDGTTSFKPFPSFDLPVANLPAELKSGFYAGKALAEQPWIKAPTTTTARDGLGPLYNARACLACHIKGGRGHMPIEGGELQHAIVRLSLPSADTGSLTAGVVPEPVYGDQLQTQSIALRHQLRHLADHTGFADDDVSPEAYVYVHWQVSEFRYPDGHTVKLQKPQMRFENLGYGPFQPDTQVSLRNAPAIQGMGLIEAIRQADIDALVDPNDRDGDGISGRLNRVWDAQAATWVPGRFGLKANRPTLATAVAGAFTNDVGITNPLFPQQPCTDAQVSCRKQVTGNDEEGVELPAGLLELVVNFNRYLGVPASRYSDSLAPGRDAFFNSGCAGCHRPGYVTSSAAPAVLAGQTIWPYSDLLLHDMGPELADNRPDFAATGSEWRTPPLWGLGLQRQVNGSRHLLHDGRAGTVEEAILWHGGEAEAARWAFIHLAADNRQLLIQFVESL